MAIDIVTVHLLKDKPRAQFFITLAIITADSTIDLITIIPPTMIVPRNVQTSPFLQEIHPIYGHDSATTAKNFLSFTFLLTLYKKEKFMQHIH